MTRKLTYTIDEAAEATGLSRSSLYRHMDSGDLNSFRLGSRRLIDANELQSFIDRAQRAA